MKPTTQYCINERTGQIFPYTVNADFSTTFPPGVFLTYQDNFVAGFKDESEARHWINRKRRPAPTYAELASARGN